MLMLTHALLCSLLVSVVLAQAPASNDDVFRYRGADRDARLVERAKREGRVVLYTSLAPTESKPLADAFEKKYGVKVELWRALSDQVVQRVDHRGAGQAACRGRDRDQRPGDGDAGAREAARRVPFAAPRRPARPGHSARTAPGSRIA